MSFPLYDIYTDVAILNYETTLTHQFSCETKISKNQTIDK